MAVDDSNRIINGHFLDVHWIDRSRQGNACIEVATLTQVMVRSGHQVVF
ncbi:hypothetical protein [Janthinobacterium sp.]|nr:hypothetical protein [Janthinobacterium sp.]